MITDKEILIELINEIPEGKLTDVIDFIGYLKVKNNREISKDLETASESSMGFWDNDIDDETWNNA